MRRSSHVALLAMTVLLGCTPGRHPNQDPSGSTRLDATAVDDVGDTGASHSGGTATSDSARWTDTGAWAVRTDTGGDAAPEPPAPVDDVGDTGASDSGGFDTSDSAGWNDTGAWAVRTDTGGDAEPEPPVPLVPPLVLPRERVRSCRDATRTGVADLDPDGDGPESAAPVWCEARWDGGGWQLLSVVHDATSRPAFGPATCASALGPCSGTIPERQRRPDVAPDLLFATATGSTWVRVERLAPPGRGGLIDYIEGRLTLDDGDCGLGSDNYCRLPGTAIPDAGVAILGWSPGWNPRFTTINRAWYQRGGVFFGKDGGGVNDHVLSFNYDAWCGAGGLDVSRSATSGFGTRVCGADAAVYFRYDP